MKLSRLTRPASALGVVAIVASLTMLTSRSLVMASPVLANPVSAAGVQAAPAAQAPASTQAPPPPPPPGENPMASGPPPGLPPGAPRDFPAPVNLKVLPRGLTGAQVHEIMEQWEGELGTGCKTCHAVDTKSPAINGRPRLNFADDSKDEKKTARTMYKMTEDINTNYVAKIDSSGAPVTCGTCHRGHLGPEPFVPAPQKDRTPPKDHAH